MITTIRHESRMSVGGPNVPVTVRRLSMGNLAAERLVRGGSIEVDTMRVRERAVNWLALALLLAAWNVEARLDATKPGPLTGHTTRCARSTGDGFDWTEPKPTRWTSCAARDPSPRGA
jgi:hypothetical protein